MEKAALISRLNQHLPEPTSPYIANWIFAYDVAFKITKKRKTKLGDYRHPHGKHSHRITINGSLNPYAFFLTTVHEFAHLVTWNAHKNKVRPHGKEWKQNFRELMHPFLDEEYLPEPIILAFEHHLINPKASSGSDLKLTAVLKQYDQHSAIHVEELAPGTIFRIGNKVFVKGKKLRTRYECQLVHNRRKYLVHAFAEVDEIKT